MSGDSIKRKANQNWKKKAKYSRVSFRRDLHCASCSVAEFQLFMYYIVTITIKQLFMNGVTEGQSRI